jgi:hypothetical protein
MIPADGRESLPLRIGRIRSALVTGSAITSRAFRLYHNPHVLDSFRAYGPPIPSPECKSQLGELMSCKVCSSFQQLDFPAELNFTFPGLRRTNLSAVYVCHRVLVCLDCGYAELVIPAPKLDRLKQGMGEPLTGNGHRVATLLRNRTVSAARRRGMHNAKSDRPTT